MKRINPRSDETRNLNSELKNKKQKFNLKTLIEEKRLVRLDQLKKIAIFSIPAQSGIFNDSEIASFIKQMRKPYIPGTEIKGAIRTAVLYCALLEDTVLQSWTRQMLTDFGNNNRSNISAVKNQQRLDRSQQELKKKLEKEMSKISDQLQEKVFNIKPKDAKYDVMKFLQIGDSCLMEPSSVLSVSYVEPFNMSSKFKVFYEYLRPQTEIGITSFCLEKRNALDPKLNKMGFNDAHKKLMNGLDSILACCHSFSSDLLKKEIEYFNEHGKADIGNHLKDVFELNTPQTPVLRIGKDEGYNSLTVGMAIKKLMPDLYENVLIHATKNKSYDSTHGGPFPKTRKIVKWEDKELTSGWVQLVPEMSLDPIISMSTQQTGQAGRVDLTALQNKFGGKRGR